MIETKKIDTSVYYLTKFNISNIKEYKQTMLNISKHNNLFWVGDICFGTAYIRDYERRTYIKCSDFDLSPHNAKGYFHKGKFYPFSKSEMNRGKIKSKKNRTFGGG